MQRAALPASPEARPVLAQAQMERRRATPQP
jgi:hypothetical protein